MNQAQQIIHKYPNLKTKQLGSDENTFGINLYIEKGVITIYFKKKIFNHNKNSKWLCYKDFNELFEEIDKILLPKKEVVIQTIENENNGTLVCIEHIKKKIETIEQIKGNNAVSMMLKTICLELEQYL